MRNPLPTVVKSYPYNMYIQAKFYLVSCVPFWVLHKVDIREINVILILNHPWVIPPTPSRNVHQCGLCGWINTAVNCAF